MSPDGLVRRHFGALGSECELLAFGLSEAALAEGEAWVRRAETRFTRFEAGSELSAFNRSAGAWKPVSPPMARMLRASLDAYVRSGGLVNVAILPALVAAGYSRRFADGLEAPAGPSPQAAPALPDVLEVAPGQARLRAGCAIDLGGIAKGMLADELALRLGGNVLCNLGGDLRARGAGPGEGWPVGLPDGRTVAITDAALATSGTTRRRWGQGLHHLIDPRSGAPASTDVESVSVAAGDALSAEIYAKAALLLGASHGRRFLRERGLFHVMLEGRPA